MINKLRYATISDVGVMDLKFYNDGNIPDLIKFCKDNLITYLPSKDRKTIYKLTEKGFDHQLLLIELCVNPFDRLFDTNTLKKFEKVDHNEIRFITENGKIKGVVHIIDYNNEFLQVEFYRAFYRFENYVRKLLINSNYKNDDFIDWVKERAETETNPEIQKHWSNRYKVLIPDNKKSLHRVQLQRLEANPFQTFYMLELIEFAIRKGIIDKKYINQHEINSLRNCIAHNKDFTSIIENTTGELIYNFKNLQKFINQANSFFSAYEYLEELTKDSKSELYQISIIDKTLTT